MGVSVFETDANTLTIYQKNFLVWIYIKPNTMQMAILLNFVNFKLDNTMKHYILIAAMFFGLNAYCQTIKALETEWTLSDAECNNSYFKDINNVLDKFIGTWKYEDVVSNTRFEITFTKLLRMENIHQNGFDDELFAKFKLIVNGVEHYNTYTTPCEDCFIPLGFGLFVEGYDSNFSAIITQPNSNMYIGAFAEPAIEKYVTSSNLKLQFQFNLGSPPNLVWTNIVDKKIRIATGQHMNVYQMPMNMVLVKQ